MQVGDNVTESNMDTKTAAYLEGFIKRSADLGLDPELMLEKLGIDVQGLKQAQIGTVLPEIMTNPYLRSYRGGALTSLYQHAQAKKQLRDALGLRAADIPYSVAHPYALRYGSSLGGMAVGAGIGALAGGSQNRGTGAGVGGAIGALLGALAKYPIHARGRAKLRDSLRGRRAGDEDNNNETKHDGLPEKADVKQAQFKTLGGVGGALGGAAIGTGLAESIPDNFSLFPGKLRYTPGLAGGKPTLGNRARAALNTRTVDEAALARLLAVLGTAGIGGMVGRGVGAIGNYAVRNTREQEEHEKQAQWATNALEAVRRAGLRTADAVRNVPQVAQLQQAWKVMSPAQKEMIVNSLMGAGIGAGTLGVSRALTPQDDDQDKGVISQALLGALLGGAAGAGYTGMKHLWKDRPPAPRPAPTGPIDAAGRAVDDAATSVVIKGIKNPGATIGGALGAASKGPAIYRHGLEGHKNLAARLRDLTAHKDPATAQAAADALKMYDKLIATRPGRTRPGRIHKPTHGGGVKGFLNRLKKPAPGAVARTTPAAQRVNIRPPKARGAVGRAIQQHLPGSTARRSLRGAANKRLSLRGGVNPLSLGLNIAGGAYLGSKVDNYVLGRRGDATARGYATGGTQ